MMTKTLGTFDINTIDERARLVSPEEMLIILVFRHILTDDCSRPFYVTDYGDLCLCCTTTGRSVFPKVEVRTRACLTQRGVEAQACGAFNVHSAKHAWNTPTFGSYTLQNRDF